MANYTATSLTGDPKWIPGDLVEAKASFAIGTTVATADTVTWTNALPPLNLPTRLVDGYLDTPEFDTNASPGNFNVGDGITPNAYRTNTPMGGADNRRVFVTFDGASLNALVVGRDIVITVGAIGTGAASITGGLIKATYRCG